MRLPNPVWNAPRIARRPLLAAACVALFAYGCQKVSWYHHTATEGALRTYAIDDAALAPFRAGEVVVVPVIVAGHAQLTLHFLSKKPTALKLERVTVDDKSMDLGETLQVDQKVDGKEVYRVSKVVPITGVASGAPFEELGRDGYQVAVFVDGTKLDYEFPRTTSHEPACAGW